jgi:organic hydroperoxide reductase OsmC/OhrA
VDLVHGDGGFFLRAWFTVSLPGVDPVVAQALLDAANQTCPYSKAMRGNIRVSMQLAAAEPA